MRLATAGRHIQEEPATGKEERDDQLPRQRRQPAPPGQLFHGQVRGPGAGVCPPAPALITLVKIRPLKPEFWDDELLGSMPPGARLTYECCWSLADDAGNLKGSPRYIWLQAFPYDELTPLDDVERWLRLLERSKRLIPYTVNGQRYYHGPTFAEHFNVRKDRLFIRYPKMRKREKTNTCDDGASEAPTDDGHMSGSSQHFAACSGSGSGSGSGDLGTNVPLSPSPKDDLPAPSSQEHPRRNAKTCPSLATLTSEENAHLMIGDSRAAAARRLFLDWCEIHGRAGTTRLTPKREKKVIERLDDGYDEELIRKAIRGIRLSEYHMLKGYLDLELICRDGDHLERYADWADNPPKDAPPQRRHEDMERWEQLGISKQAFLDHGEEGGR